MPTMDEKTRQLLYNTGDASILKRRIRITNPRPNVAGEIDSS